MKSISILILAALYVACASEEIVETPPVLTEASSSPKPQAEVSADIAWTARIKSNLEPAIESKIGLRNRVDTYGPNKPIRIVFLDLPPRTVPKAMPNGEIKNILNAKGAPSYIKVLIRQLIEDMRLEVKGFQMYNGKLHPEKPTPFQ
jgi:hypothetical protein